MCRHPQVQQHFRKDGSRDVWLEFMDAMLAITQLGKTVAAWVVKKATRRQVIIQKNHAVNELDDFEDAFIEVEPELADQELCIIH